MATTSSTTRSRTAEPAEKTADSEQPKQADSGNAPQQPDFSDSKLVQGGEWNPETHGEPPDKRPATDI